MEERDVHSLFSLFDSNRNGRINYEEFLREITGEMNEFRKELVRGAFKKFDHDGGSRVDVNNVKGLYSASLHPDVKSGKKSEDEILMEFLDTFELHYRMKHKNLRDTTVSLEEFIEYYNNLSCSILDDEYFELIINNSWNLKNKNFSRGWAKF